MENIVKFDKPYKFEGKEYDSLDLSVLQRNSRTIGAERRKNRNRMHIVRYADSNRKLNNFGL